MQAHFVVPANSELKAAEKSKSSYLTFLADSVPMFTIHRLPPGESAVKYSPRAAGTDALPLFENLALALVVRR
jgi:hypothetical protein